MIWDIAKIMYKPGDQVVDPNNAAQTAPRCPHDFTAKTQHHLTEAAELICFYDTIGCEMTPVNMQHDPIIGDFTNQWKLLMECKNSDQGKALKLMHEFVVGLV